MVFYSGDFGSEVSRGENSYLMVSVNGTLQQGHCWLGEVGDDVGALGGGPRFHFIPQSLTIIVTEADSRDGY